MPPLPHRLAAHQDVFGEVEVGEQARLLVDRGDAVFLGLAGAAEVHRLAVEEYLARCRAGGPRS